MRTEASEKWVRAMVGGTAVVDSRAPLLFWEQKFPIPAYAFTPEDVRMDLLLPAGTPPTGEPTFFGPKGPVAQWFDVQAGGRELPNAAWRRDAPELEGRITFTWAPDAFDRWLEEEEEVHSHPRDPHKRVEVLPSSRHITVSLDGVLLADSIEPVLLFETYLPTRYYFPRTDVHLDRLSAGSNRSHCPYKGYAENYWDAPGSPSVAWSYPDPYPAVWRIKDRIAFYNESVDITVDGAAVPRPRSIFSKTKNRPGE
ncbi:hypothetical protein ART_0830 [Arthrobacter sp. PAMC 25486]|uniref:DUF427 domain-containing protein n=1 Tax=Arthrobacter sp. PAMC 25486 TaxID=1494608 RepID=UPI000535AF64|nr:DUF427 domain-containing protein [Arthrobacter sp. PAMC 25486]AIY00429.1 hypothetical protein ART_0830 [Arthrobacter sp. PAMC 25486]